MGVISQSKSLVGLYGQMIISYADLRMKVRDKQSFDGPFKFISQALTKLDQGEIEWVGAADNPARVMLDDDVVEDTSNNMFNG